MKLKTKYILFVSFIHIILILLSLRMFKENIYYFLAAEVFIICTIIIAIILYRQFIQPVQTLSSGLEFLKDKDFTMKMVTTGHYEMDQLIGVFNKMIDQLREEKLKQKEQHFLLEKLVHASPAGIIILDFDEIITNINPAALSYLKSDLNKVLSKKLTEIPSRLSSLLAGLEVGKPQTISLSGIETFKCQKASFLDRGFNHHFILVEQLTDEIIKTEKKAYEKVIRMMSHEINNSVGAVNSILSSCLTYKNKLTQKEQEQFENAINVAIERNVHLNKFMGNFADIVRIPQPTKKKTDLHQLLKKVHILMQNELDKHQIEWEWQLQKEDFLLEMDEQQMEQVLVNIFKNALEAIDKDGKITIVTLTKQLIIRDSGKGIPEDIQQKLFTPFFSTKKNGQGIGLTLTREILLNHGFKFSLETNEKDETEFVMEF